MLSVGTKHIGSSPEMDDSIIRDFVSQVSQVIAPKKEFSIRAPDAPSSSGGTTYRAPDAPSSSGGTTYRAPDVSTGGTRAPDASTGGTRAPDASTGGTRAPDTNADGTSAPTSPTDVKIELTLKSTRPKDQSTDHSPDGKNKQISDAEKQKNDWLSKVGGLSGLAMVGLTIALATTIAAKTGEQFTACVNANISIKKVEPTPRVPSWLPEWDWVVNMFPLPKTVDVTYTVDTSYTPLAKSDTWDISGTGTMIDRNAVPLVKVLEGKVIRIKCGADDCSNVKSTQGSAQVNCDFADRLNDAVAEVATDIGSTLGRFAESAGSMFIQFLPIIILIIAVYFAFTLFKKDS